MGIILKWIFKKWDGRAWTGLIWLERGTVPMYITYGLHKSVEFID